MTTPLQFLAGARALQGEGQGLPVQLLGSSAVTIGGATFYVDGATIRGLAADRPDAAAAHAVIPYATYWAVDTGAITVTDGTNWRDV